MLAVVVAVGLGLIALERLYPARALPRVRAWWPRVVLLNGTQLGVVVLAGWLWEGSLARRAVFSISDHAGPWAAGGIAYLVVATVYYFWHRVRHESALFWRLCHQIHHSPRRLEIVTAFYKHPVEVVCNCLVSSAITYLLLGCSVPAAAVCTLLCALAEFFYHLNVRTPRWIGWLVQRPESHRVHHERARHSRNYGDLPLIDLIFGTLENPTREVAECGFTPEREDRFAAMLAFTDVHAPPTAPAPEPVEARITCLGCRKRWVCQQQSGALKDTTRRLS